MNNKFKIFVGGPIKAFQYKSGFDVIFRRLLESIHKVILDSGYTIYSAHIDEKWGEIEIDGLSTYIFHRDFKWMKLCDIFIAILPLNNEGEPVRTDGTCIELGWASALEKPIILITEHDISHHSHLIKGLVGSASVLLCNLSQISANPSLLIPKIEEAISQSKNSIS